MSSTSDPTPAMIDRAVAWRKFVKLLDTYFGEAASTLEHRSQQSSHLASSINEKDLHSLVPYFAPRGKSGVNDVLPTITSMHEAEAKAAAKASQLIGTQLRSELEALTADIDKSIEDFRGYSASFAEGDSAPKPDSTKEAFAGNSSSSTADLLHGPLKPQIKQYQEAVAAAAAHKSPKVDPYILKLSIDKKISKLSKNQTQLSDSYAYTQDASKEVDAGVSDRLQSILGRYADSVGKQGQATLEGSSALLGGFLAHPKLFEYNHFLHSSKAPKAFQSEQAKSSSRQPQAREQAYPDEDSIYSKALRTGELERRTKILHSYSPGEYVLTPQSLIEIKNGLPVWSLDLIGAKLLEDHKAADANQFVLQARQHGSSSGKQHTFVFRARVAQNWRRELAAITAGQVPPSLESIVHAQNSPAAEPTSAATGVGAAHAGSADTRGPAPAYDTPNTTAKTAEPASAVAGAGGAATSRPNPTDRLDSTDAIPPSSKYDMKSESPKAAGTQTVGLGPEPTEPFPKVERQSDTSSANPFGDPPSNESLTGVPVAGAAGAAAAAAPSFGHEAPANKDLGTERTLDPRADSSTIGKYAGTDEVPTEGISSLSTKDTTAPLESSRNPFGSASSAGRELGQGAPYDFKEGQLERPVDKVDSARDPRFAAVAGGDDIGSSERDYGSSAPFDLKESQLQHPVDKVEPSRDPRLASVAGGDVGSTDRAYGSSAPFDLKESQIQHPVDKVDTRRDPRFGSGSTGSERELGQAAPYDFNESQINNPVDNVYAGQDSSLASNAPRGAAAGTVAGGAAGFNSRGPYEYQESQLSHPTDKVPEQGAVGSHPRGNTGILDSSQRDHGFYDATESQLSHPVDRVDPSAAAATSHLAHVPSHHESDSEVSETEQDFNDYFDKDDVDEPRKGTLAWQAQNDMRVFDKPVGHAYVDDPRPGFVKTAEDEDDDASTWSYDLTHQNALNTYRTDRNFKPADADLPVQTERRLTNTQHKLERPLVDPMRTEADALDDPEQALQRRRSSVNAHAKPHRSGSRRATGSYGDEELKPLSGLSSQEKKEALTGDSALVFGGGLPSTTSGGPKI